MSSPVPTAADIIIKGRHKPKAEVWEDARGHYRFEAFTVDENPWTLRVNFALDTVIVQHSGLADRFIVYVQSKPLPTTYRKPETAMAAAVEEAEKQRDEPPDDPPDE